jgi:hypothetical protein
MGDGTVAVAQGQWRSGFGADWPEPSVPVRPWFVRSGIACTDRAGGGPADGATGDGATADRASADGVTAAARAAL